MAWFPENQNIPHGSNLRVSYETILLCASALNKEKRSPIQMDDFTFIIPVGIDCHDRLENLSDVLLYILINTTAKVKIVWSETESNIKSNSTPLYKIIEATERTPSSFIHYFRKHSSDESFADLAIFKDEMPLDPPVALLFSLLTASMIGREFKIGTSGTWWETLNANPVMTSAFQDFMFEALDRVEVSLVFRPNGSPFDRMRYINLALADVDTEFVCNHDADVLLTRSAIINTVNQLKETTADFVYPYAHRNTSKSQIRMFRTPEVNNDITLACLTGDFTPLTMRQSYITWDAAYGQSVFARTESYKSVGGENENFKSWGAEDVERYVRFVKLGYVVGRANSGFVIHLEHERGPDSGKENPLFKKNEELWTYLQKLDPQSLLKTYQDLEYVEKRGFNVKPGRGLRA